MKKENNLAVQRPDIAKEWHPIKNEDLKASDVTCGSNKKVWWLCSNSSLHIWQAKINSRTRKNTTGCPYCAGRKLCADNNLAFKNPILAKEWHPTLNGELQPTDVLPYSNKKVWWLCSKNILHEYEATINNRSKRTGCPYCAGKKLCADNNLAYLNPELAKEWHPTLNGELQPTDVTCGRDKKIWWLCPKSILHEYYSSIFNRSIGMGCPYCVGKKVCGDNNLDFKYPEIANEWHPTLNGELKPTDVTHGISKKVWWQCAKKLSHIWKASINHRSTGSGCPHCNKEIQTSFPEQAIYFYMKQVFSDALNRFNFEGSRLELDIYIPQYKIGIEYDGAYYHKNPIRDERKSKFMMERCTFVRVREEKCPNLTTDESIIFVDGSDKSLEKAIDELFKHIQKVTNKNLIYDINIERDRIAIYELMQMSEKINSLAFLNPTLAKEWHPTKNRDLQSLHVTCGSNKKVWWLCPKNNLHDYQAIINHRTGGKGCPHCYKEKRAKSALK